MSLADRTWREELFPNLTIRGRMIWWFAFTWFAVGAGFGFAVGVWVLL
jgi:hypothetical protein